MGPGGVVFLDACVLYPPLVRSVLLAVAAADAYTPRWSQRVLEEWRIAVARKQGEPAAISAEAARNAMARDFPGACVDVDPATEAWITLPDPADAHVLAGAMAAGAGTVLTFNLRDFPRAALHDTGVTARHPDGFLWELFSLAPDLCTPAIRTALADHDVPPDRARAALKRARLSRFAKAWAAADIA